MDTSSLSIPSISPQELALSIGMPDAPLVLDVRRQPRFDESSRILATALRCTPENVAALATAGPPRSVVVYCVYGHNVSEEAVTTLQQAGWDARRFEGGIEGGQDGVDTQHNIDLWRGQPALSITKRADLGVTGEAASRWITRARPKIDRVACPWLIRRFIDPRAEFFYVPAEQVFDEAKRLGAVAYDIPGAPISHDAELCSFDTLMAAFDLHDAALATLATLATIIRGADTDRCELAPQSAGLLAVSLGLSRLHAEDDHAMLQAAMPVYDALYAWCRQAQGETHAWTPATSAKAAA